jgi:hypothetical protein
MSNLARLSEDDWKTIMPGEPIVLGNTILTVKPYSLKSIISMSNAFKVLFDAIKESDISVNNWNDPAQAVKLFQLVAANAPVIIEEAIGLHRDDISGLPLALGVVVIEKIVRVNLESQKGFSEALRYLGKMMGIDLAYPVAEEETAK